MSAATATAIALANDKVETKINENKQCELSLLGLLGLPPTTSPHMLANSTMAHFDKQLAPQLQAFIFVRLFPDLTTGRGYKHQKKGKLAEAIEGTEDSCLIAKAFALRGKAVKLRPPLTVAVPSGAPAVARPPPVVLPLGGRA